MLNNARKIISSWIAKANKLKYNFSFNQMVENASGEPSDRTAYDVGEEPIHIDYSHVESDPEDNEPF